MIVDKNESEITVLGEVQKFKVGIDEKNLNHIVTILSSNLYSNPWESFLRETVSNAVDSHAEAGSKEPIIIQITDTDISIRDFGTGISPERFKEIYLNIGSSTKRDSNEYIGYFGLGRFSALAVADLVNITSFYEGKAYYYVMNKDIDQLHIDILDVLPTIEHNGVEVKVPIGNFSYKHLKCLSFIDNLYIDGYNNSFNEKTIISCKNFKLAQLPLSLNDYERNHLVLVGKIPYKIDISNINFNHSWEYTLRGVYPQIQVGEVDITPNREALIYSERTVKALQKAYDATIKELEEMWYIKCTTEVSSITDYISTLNDSSNYLDIEGFSLHLPSYLGKDCTYSKYKNWNNIDIAYRKRIIYSIIHSDLIVFEELYSDGSVSKANRGFTVDSAIRYIKYDYRMLLNLPSASGLSGQYFNSFVNSKYPNKDFKVIISKHLTEFGKLSKSSIYRWLQKNSVVTGIDNNTNSLILFTIQFVRELLLYFKPKTITEDIIHSAEYIQYKKQKISEKKKHAKTIAQNTKICFSIFSRDGFIEKKTFTIDDMVYKLKRDYSNKRIVYAELGREYIDFLTGIRYPNLIILGVAKSNIQYLVDGLPQWIQPIESIDFSKDKYIRRCITMHHLRSMPNINIAVSEAYPTDINNLIRQLKTWEDTYNTYRIPSQFLDRMKSFVGTNYDIEIMAVFNQVKEYLKVSYAVDRSYSFGLSNYICYFLLAKRKKIRLRYDFYHKIKENINDFSKYVDEICE